MKVSGECRWCGVKYEIRRNVFYRNVINRGYCSTQCRIDSEGKSKLKRNKAEQCLSIVKLSYL